MCVSQEHGLGVVPVELRASHGESASHALEDALLKTFLELFNISLMLTLKLFNGGHNTRSISGGERNVLKLAVEVELDVACFEVVVVDFDASIEARALRVNTPLALPLAAPVRSKVQVDARDVNLQVT
jgi:hypothetical protein